MDCPIDQLAASLGPRTGLAEPLFQQGIHRTWKQSSATLNAGIVVLFILLGNAGKHFIRWPAVELPILGDPMTASTAAYQERDGPVPLQKGYAVGPGEDGCAGAGVLTKWNAMKRFGFIQPDDRGELLFCHESNFVNGDGSVREGDHVGYVKKWNAERKKFDALVVACDGPTRPPPKKKVKENSDDETEESSSEQPPEDEPGTGVMRKWHGEKGYGFILPDGKTRADDSLFVHVTGLAGGGMNIKDGDPVSYVKRFNGRKGKCEAVEVKVIDPNAKNADDEEEKDDVWGNDNDDNGGQADADDPD